MEKPQNCIIAIFGATGDLTNRKLMPALYELFKQDILPKKFAVLGISRSQLSDDDFRGSMRDDLKSAAGTSDDWKLNDFLKKLFYIPTDISSPEDYKKIAEKLLNLDNTCGSNCNYIFYLATPPSLFEIISENLASAGLNKKTVGYRRIVVEKPFGYDYNSAVELNEKLHQFFEEDQIYRIDHYLGKETVQNIFVTRFSNGIYEPIWNRNYVQYVEVTSAESIGVENRGEYYDHAGALRDMVQNHLMQIVGFIALEPPSSFDANAIRNEQLKVLQSLRPLTEGDVESCVVRGQYMESTIRGEKVKGYREESRVDTNSRTETFVAMKFYIDNWRWGGVPFYIRTGKRLPTRVTEAVIHFKPTPHSLFSSNNIQPPANQLIIRIQPDEGILLKFGMKVPGAGYEVQNANMDFHYTDFANVHIPEAYERLLHDCMIGDATLFARADAVEAAWKFVEPIQNAWANNPDLKIFGYPAGTWGPDKADDLIEGVADTWRYPCKNLTDDGVTCEL